MIDLHTHSTYSDGTMTPEELVKHAKEIGLDAVALTDHNTIDGLKEFNEAGKLYGIETISGIEFSTKTGPHSFHILALFVPQDSYQKIEKYLYKYQQERIKCNKKLVEKLNENGISISYDSIVRKYGSENFNRVAIANELIDLGFADSVKGAFEIYLDEEEQIYSKAKPDTFKTIKFIKSLGAAAVWAHPLKNSDYELMRKLECEYLPEAIENGLDGIEVVHSSYSHRKNHFAECLADDFNLVKCGGSDFHGENKPNIKLGDFWVENETLDQLKNKIRKIEFEKIGEICNGKFINSNRRIDVDPNLGEFIFTDELLKSKAFKKSVPVYYLTPEEMNEYFSKKDNRREELCSILDIIKEDYPGWDPSYGYNKFDIKYNDSCVDEVLFEIQRQLIGWEKEGDMLDKEPYCSLYKKIVNKLNTINFDDKTLGFYLKDSVRFKNGIYLCPEMIEFRNDDFKVALSSVLLHEYIHYLHNSVRKPLKNKNAEYTALCETIAQTYQSMYVERIIQTDNYFSLLKWVHEIADAKNRLFPTWPYKGEGIIRRYCEITPNSKKEDVINEIIKLSTTNWKNAYQYIKDLEKTIQKEKK